MAFKQEVNVPLITTIGAVSAVLVIVLILGTEAWYHSEEQAQMSIEADQYPYQMLTQLKQQQKAVLDNPDHPYRWVDQKNGIVAIPIEQAMQIMAQTLGKPPTASADASSIGAK